MFVHKWRFTGISKRTMRRKCSIVPFRWKLYCKRRKNCTLRPLRFSASLRLNFWPQRTQSTVSCHLAKALPLFRVGVLFGQAVKFLLQDTHFTQNRAKSWPFCVFSRVFSVILLNSASCPSTNPERRKSQRFLEFWCVSPAVTGRRAAGAWRVDGCHYNLPQVLEKRTLR